MKNICSVKGCESDYYSRGFCSKHYQRWRKFDDPLKTKICRDHDSTCSVDGCDRPHKGHGYCALHHKRLWANGSIGPAGRLVGKKGDGHIDKRGYKTITVDGDQIYEHRHVMELKLGRKLKNKEIVHHEDRDKLNNDEDNLILFSNHSAHKSYHAEQDNIAFKFWVKHREGLA